MLLAIDAGNSNIVLGCIREGKILLVARMATEIIKTDDQYAVQIDGILKMHGIDADKLDNCIISSVVPPLIDTLKRAVEHLTGKVPLVVGPGIKTGLNIKIDNPAQLGSDLVVDAVAAINQYPTPIVVIDMGTATTFSVIGEDMAYLGGMIMPGVRLSLQALSGGTSQLPGISIEPPPRLIGKNTIDCMKSGIVNGNAAMIDGILSRIEEELGKKPTAVATGGLSSVIIPHCRNKIIYDETLLLKGLALIYEKNKK
ncbi:MAG: type III pantothenate kinase [Oscillospiraceae bacterium]